MSGGESNAEPEPKQFSVSRRTFFVVAIAGGTAATLATLSIPAVRDPLFQKIDAKPITERVISEAVANRRSAFWTVLETVGVWAANIGLGALIDRFGVSHGGRASDGEYYAEQAEDHAVSLYIQQCWVLPIIEETCFRLFPSALYSEEQPSNVKMHWGMGLASATVFAAIHNFSKPEQDKIAVHFDSVPLEQFVLGIYCWYAQRKGGFGHAAGSHVLYNHLCEAYWHLYEKKQFEQVVDEAIAPESEKLS